MAKEIARIDFLKTFIKSAKVMTENLQIEEPGDMRYWKISKKVSDLYSALEFAAFELNRDYGFHIAIPKKVSEEDFPRAEAFYRLNQDILAEAENNEAFQNAVFLMNPAKKSFEPRLELVCREVNDNGDEFDRYWLNRILTLDTSFTETMTSEIFSEIRNEFLDIQLAEQMLSTLVKRGAIVDSSDVEGVRSVLAAAADVYAKNPDFVSEEELTNEMIRRFQANCSWDGKSLPVRETVSDYMEEFTTIISKKRPMLVRFDTNNDAALWALNDYDNCLNDKAYVRLDRQIHFNRENGIMPMEYAIPEHHDLKQIFVEPGALEEFDIHENAFKPGSKEEFWNNYATDELVSEELGDDIEEMIGQMLLIADKDLGDIETILDDLEDKSIQKGFDEEDDDDSLEIQFGGSFSAPESEEDIERKKQVLAFAGEVLDLNKVISRFYDIEMNDTPSNRKIINSFSADKKWNDFTFSSLHMLFNDFDMNLEKNQSILLPAEKSEGLRPGAVNELVDLPSSLEKRNVLKLFRQGLNKLEFEMVNQKLDYERDMVDDITIFHQSEQGKLIEDMWMVSELFPQIDEERLTDLVKDINAGAVTNFVVPLYDDCEPEENAGFKLLEGIIDLEELPLEARSLVKKVAGRHVERVLKVHNKLLDDGDFDRDLYDVVDEYKNIQKNIDDVSKNRLMVNECFAEEDRIYREYRNFKKRQETKETSAFYDVLWQDRICNN